MNLLLLSVLVVLMPLQSVAAAVAMLPVPIEQSATMAMQADTAMRMTDGLHNCRHCEQQACGDQSRCQSGQCATALVMALSRLNFTFDFTLPQFAAQYVEQLPVASPFLHFRPPRA